MSGRASASPSVAGNEPASPSSDHHANIDERAEAEPPPQIPTPAPAPVPTKIKRKQRQRQRQKQKRQQPIRRSARVKKTARTSKATAHSAGGS
ncbi:hypothetical protein BPAE_0034g00020 [Botrytis paeoniae]|uniref:Uncharacterized protein n=1 Tax=Botrytis paeoniae TaxID=278948 RepID=A0A4Z1G113_9HELO|nr:hypothetical protein BPAE_0034g00020 [Botrytis paeoniae]